MFREVFLAHNQSFANASVGDRTWNAELPTDAGAFPQDVTIRNEDTIKE